MPYTQGHILITVGGSAYEGAETWQFGVRALPTGGIISDAQLQLLADGIAPATSSLWATPGAEFPATHGLGWIKAAHLDVEGHYPPASVPGIHTYVSPVAGTATSCIPQQTTCLTLLTNIPRGRGSHGRLYPPPQGATALGVDGRRTASQVGFFAGYWKLWLNAIVSQSQVDNIAVMSKLGTGTTGVVDRIGVGRVIDTMRSRRRSLLEDRLPLAL